MSCCLKLRGCKIPVTLLLLILYTCYLLVGATVFWALESKAEVDLSQNFQHEKWELLKNYTCMDNETLEQFIVGIIKAYKNGVIIQGNTSEFGTWSFTGSFFFSVTAITTIGYGNISPTTVGGRIFCIVFALFGIPLNLILLNRIGQRMLSLVHQGATFLGNKGNRQKSAKILVNVCSLVTGLLLFFLLPPILFRSIEGWTYEEGFYYSFITLSTIGFGDYVIGRIPGKNYPSWYRNLIALWILFGMAWLALIISLCINLLENYQEICTKTKNSEKVEHELIDVVQNGDLCPVLQDNAENSETSCGKDTNTESPD
ncbi:potassium channel subfamily K member 17 [Bombina bombina]|uniref:potassium channel subfamily K member 17 n=1 Tax=Bombina bombina TaxID=8345 RepID=UPI00235ADA4B|nr:potassium channel subfamily K member 17 [Bombina bombina]